VSGAVGVASDAGTRVLALSGELRHDNAAALEELIERWFESDSIEINEVIIDLNALQFMDSTVIGMLAAIARGLNQHGLGKAVVFSTRAEINQLLHSLRLDEVLTVVESDTAAATELVPTQLHSERGQVSADVILRAHERLMELSDSNRAAFQPVVELLREELGR